MKNPKNKFKAALREGHQQIGLWNTLGGSINAELLAGCGFDWVVLDTEHSPVDVVDVLAPLQAMAAYPETTAVVRPAWNDAVLIKRYLDMGAQTLLLPYVQNADEARAAVAAIRYAPAGMRGMAGMTRASRFGQVENYARTAEEEICLILQVETVEAMGNLEEIAQVEGVDGIFVGPADLAASLGYPGQSNHPDVIAAIEDIIARLKKIGVPSGILTLNEEFAKRCIELGTGFTAVGIDMSLLAGAARSLRTKFE